MLDGGGLEWTGREGARPTKLKLDLRLDVLPVFRAASVSAARRRKYASREPRGPDPENETGTINRNPPRALVHIQFAARVCSLSKYDGIPGDSSSARAILASAGT